MSRRTEQPSEGISASFPTAGMGRLGALLLALVLALTLAATPLGALSAPLAEQVVVVANTDGTGVNLRPSAGVTGAPLAHYPDGARLVVIGQSQDGDGHTWLPVRGPDGNQGWVAAEFTIPATAGSDAAASDDASATPADVAAPSAPAESASPPSQVAGHFMVAIDPGHGGGEIGASNPAYGLVEKNINLAIALRLAARLEAAGYGYVLTREADRAVNQAHEDLNGNGVVDVDDDLQARVDVANGANADVLVSIHNNGAASPTVRGTSVWYCQDHPQGARAARLAELLQGALLDHLRSVSYEPVDAGFHDDVPLGKPYGHLFVVGVKTPRVARESRMPGVVGESLYVTSNVEGALLTRDDVLDTLAGAYFDAVTVFLAESSASTG